MRASWKQVALGLAMLLGAGRALADSKIRGKVVDSQGKGIEGVEIRASDPKSGKQYRFKSGKDGSFYQRGIHPTIYKLVFHKEGHTDHILEDVNVQAGVERTFEITLKTIEERSGELRQTTAYGSGVEAYNKGDFEAAIARADEALARDPNDARACDLKARALVSLKRYAEAVPVLEKSLTMEGSNADTREVLAKALFNAGALASNAGNLEEAVSWWEKAIAAGHADPQVHNALGRSYLARQEFDKAVKSLEAYLALSPDAKDAAEVKNLVAEIRKIGAKR